MKYLIIMILTINTAYSLCNNKTKENVASCEVNDLIEKFSPNTCNFKEDLPKTYENLVCDPQLSLSYFQGKLQRWKDRVNQYLDNKEAARVERLRLKAIKNRFKALGVKFGKYDSISGLQPYLAACNIKGVNPAIWIRKVYKKGKENLLDCLESKKDEIDSAIIEQELRNLNHKNTRKALKNYDCSTIMEPYTKLLCQSR